MFTFENLRVVGTINVDAPIDVFLKIADYIKIEERMLRKSGPEFAPMSFETVIDASEKKKTRDVPEVVQTAPGDEDKSAIDPYSRVGNYAGKNSVIEILKSYATNPAEFTREWSTASRWMEKVNLSPEATPFSVSHILGDCARWGLMERRSDYNPETYKREVRFLVPIPVAEEKTGEVPVVTTEDNRRGSAVRKARMDAGFSIAELAELLHTDAATVVKWEKGEYRIAGSVEEDLKKLFGNGLFDEAEV